MVPTRIGYTHSSQTYVHLWKMCGVSGGDMVSLGSEMGCLGTVVYLGCSSSCIYSGRKYAPNRMSTWSIHLCLPKMSSTLFVQHHDISIMHNPCTALCLLSYPSPTPGHLCLKMEQQKCRLCFCHISPSRNSPSSLQTSPAAQHSCVSGDGAGKGNRYGIRISTLTVQEEKTSFHSYSS